jgi:hypothetical protein
MKNLLPYIIVLLLILAVALITWDLKPPEYRDVMTHDTLTLPVDSATIISKATSGKIIGTYGELAKRFGKVFTNTVNDTNWFNDTNRVTINDTNFYNIPYLESRDSLNYSGFDVLNEDTLKVGLRVRVHTLALLEPVNAIETTIVVEDLIVTVPPAPVPTLVALASEHWKELGTFGFIMWLIGKLS